MLYIVVLLIILLFLYVLIKKESFIGKLSPLKKNMPYDPRCIVKIPKKKTPFYNSDYEYYVRPKCLKVI